MTRLPRTFFCSLLAFSSSPTRFFATANYCSRSILTFQCRRSTFWASPSVMASSTPTRLQESSSLSSAQSSISDPLEALGLPRPLILGSGSFTRKLILKEMGVNYHLLVRSIDERNIGDREKDDPRSLVLTLAKAKADHLVSEMQAGRTDNDLPSAPAANTKLGGWVVLTADQVVTHEGAILEKPLDIDEARSFVSRYANSAPRTVGACVLTHVPSGVQVSGVDSATIVFRPTIAEKDANGNNSLLERLLEDGAPVLKCAGGLMVEHAFVREHLERIEGTEDSVMGLSKELVARLLKELQEQLIKGGHFPNPPLD